MPRSRILSKGVAPRTLSAKPTKYVPEYVPTHEPAQLSDPTLQRVRATDSHPHLVHYMARTSN